MNFQDITNRALLVRDRYAALTSRQDRKPWGASEHTQGFVGDVGDLMKLVMAHEGYRNYPDLDAKLAHEVADCLWSIIVIADELHINLEEAFLETMEDLEERTQTP